MNVELIFLFLQSLTKLSFFNFLFLPLKSSNQHRNIGNGIGTSGVSKREPNGQATTPIGGSTCGTSASSNRGLPRVH